MKRKDGTNIVQPTRGGSPAEVKKEHIPLWKARMLNREANEAAAKEQLPEPTERVMVAGGTFDNRPQVSAGHKNKSKARRYVTNERCDTVVGGNIIFRPFGTWPDGTPKWRRLIIGGSRCENRSIISVRDDYGNNKKRCKEHLEDAKNRDVHPMDGEEGYVDLIENESE